MPKYFIAVLPPANISKEIIAIQRELEESHGAVHAQKVAPHITVVPPFEADVEKMTTFKLKLQEYLKKEPIPSITIELDNFQKFEYRTLFVDVAKNEQFEQFCKRIKLFFLQQRITRQRGEKHFFVPHITIANRDLKKKDFKLAWEEFKDRSYQRLFGLKTLCIFKHNGVKWQVEEIIVQ